jgi:CTP synthase
LFTLIDAFGLDGVEMCKYIVVVGGVVSGTGKGISAASIGFLLSLRGLKVVPIKFDPYYNLNAGILAPREHGEVFLCEDGSETDLDLGHYERMIGTTVSSRNICTSGQLYSDLFEEQKKGKYLGQTVQTIPHVTDKIQEKLLALGKEADVVIVEVGGTVGDVESGHWFLALQQFKQRYPDDTLIILVSPILWFPAIKEFKTKPLQQSVKACQQFGLQPEVLLCRVDLDAPVNSGKMNEEQVKVAVEKILDKISNLTNVPRSAVFDAPTVKEVWQVPIEFFNRQIDDLIVDKFKFPRNGVHIRKYKEAVEKYVEAEDLPTVHIAIVGKYDNCDEAYLSLKEAIKHAGVAKNAHVVIRWISAGELEAPKDMRGIWKYFDDIEGVIVPGGFDSRGVEGKIRAIRYCREKKIPYLGICLGMQCAVIEIARNCCSLADANSTEFDPNTKNPVIHFVPGQEKVTDKSGTMRLGAYDCELVKDSIVQELYKKKLISERHRHRYEMNPDYVPKLDSVGLHVSGKNPQSGLVEMVELDRTVHPYFVATQSHPEFKSRLNSPAPLFVGLVTAALEKVDNSKTV